MFLFAVFFYNTRVFFVVVDVDDDDDDVKVETGLERHESFYN